ncbi:hypothetical protein [Sporosarcina sp. FSL K6-3508]|uniref:hypothetical protein n=1 Tax=Sporosarcina sp. FSL K6-3508 TaxID=2921557 RepID=UPI00315997FA
MIKYYLYDKSDNSLHEFDAEKARNKFYKKQSKETNFPFSIEMEDNFVITEIPTTINLYMDDGEGYSLGYLTTISVRTWLSGIVAKRGKYDEAPFTSQKKEDKSFDECLKDYIFYIMQPK